MLGGLIHRGFSAGKEGGSPAVIQPLSVTQNGQYNAPAGVNGFNPVEVKVEGSSGDTRKSILDSADVIGTLELPSDWKINIKWTGQMSFVQNNYIPIPIFLESVWAEFYNGEIFKFACPINVALLHTYSQDYYFRTKDGIVFLSEKLRNSNVSVNEISFSSSSQALISIKFTGISYDTRVIRYDISGEITDDNLYHNAKDEATGPVSFAGYSAAICRGNADDYSSDILELYSVLASLW